MKIGFLLQRRFAVIGQALAKILNQEYGLTEFCGYVMGRDGYNFINQHNPLLAGRIYLDEDIHNRYKSETINWQFIKQFEKDYGLPNLWPYLEVDRIIRSSQLVRAFPHDTPRLSHLEMVKIFQATAKAILEFFEKEKPDAMVISVAGSLGGLLLYEVARKKGVKTLVIHHTRISTRHLVSENYYDFSFVNGLYGRLRSGEASLPAERARTVQYLEKLRQNPKPYREIDSAKFHQVNRRRQFSFLNPKKIGWSIFWRLKMIARFLTNPYRDDYTNINPFWEICDNLKMKTRALIGYGGLFDKINLNEDYAFYPLHREPEIATLLLAPFYKDQLWLIKQIARSLPLNFKLYVKEHPPMMGLRKRSFYRELKKIPNLVLVSPEVDGMALVNNAKLVYTISGTAGWEAVQLNKPVIAFSDVYYTKLPWVKKCRAIADLPNLTNEQLNNFKPDDSALIDFLTAIFYESSPVDLTKIWWQESAKNVEKQTAELTPLADLIAKKLNISKHDIS